MAHVSAQARRDVRKTTEDCLLPATWELGALAALLLFYAIAGPIIGPDGHEITNTIGPLGLTVILFAGAVRMVAIDKSALWTAMMWFRVSTAVYFGVGSIIHNFFNDYTMLQVWTFFFAEKDHIAKFNVIVALSALCILSAAHFIGRLYPRHFDIVDQDPKGRFLAIAAISFVSMGYPIKYFITVPHFMGAFGDIVLPTTLTFFVTVTPPGLFLLTYWCLRFAPSKIFIPFILLLGDMLSGFLLFSKSEVLISLLMFILANIYAKFSIFRLSVAVTAFLCVYRFIEPTAGYGRTELSIRYGAIRTSSFSERFEIMSKYFASGSFHATTEPFQGALVRIAYVHSAAPAIALYDRGIPGNTLRQAPYLLIPRAIWPGKPVFDDVGEYTRLINGSITSATWMGYYAEAYWDYGWYGIPLLMLPLGAIFVFVGRYSLGLLASGRWLHFPAVFLGMWMGVRVDGSLLTDVLGNIVVLFFFHGMANIATKLLKSVAFSPSENVKIPVRRGGR